MDVRAIIDSMTAFCRFLVQFRAPAVSAWTHAMPHR